MIGISRLTACAGLGLFMLGFAAPAEALTLDFSPTDLCGAVDCGPASAPQTYGDIAGQLDVTWDADTNEAGEEELYYWESGYSDHTEVAYGANSSATVQITFIPLSGYEVTLDSFWLGNYYDNAEDTQVTIREFGGDVLYATGPISIDPSVGESFHGPWTSAVGIVLEFGPDAYNVAIDDIVYSVSPSGAAVPLPATALLLAGGVTALAGASRHRRRA